MNSYTNLGHKGEKTAVKLLKEKGFKVLFKNFISDRRTGEIDIVARDGEIICFIEVKARNQSFMLDNSEDEAWLRKHQADRINNAANNYLLKIGHPSVKYRFDLIEIKYGKMGLKSIHHWEKSFGKKGS